MEVGSVRTKSSADSISNAPGVSGRAAVAIVPSVLPVLTWKGAATTVPAANQSAMTSKEGTTERAIERARFAAGLMAVSLRWRNSGGSLHIAGQVSHATVL